MSSRPGANSRRVAVVVASVLALCALAPSAAPASAASAPEPPVVPHFVEETAHAGIEHVNTYGITPESPDGGWQGVVGGGLAVFDCDDDGRLDLYLAGGSSPSALYRNESALGGPLSFSPVDDPIIKAVHVSGAYPLDLDSDGISDLVVLRWGENHLLRGLGDCRFERADEALGLDGGTDWTTAFSATWERGAQLPTLAFGNYEVLDADGKPSGGCSGNYLLRPDAEAETYGPPVTLRPGWCALSMLFSDWDRSGRRDLRVSNDREFYGPEGQEQLWRMEPGEAPSSYSEADGWQPLRIWGMGIASQDVTGDGYPEVYLTSMFANRLQTLAAGPGRPEYVDIAEESGVASGFPVAGQDERPSTAWHPEFDDVNNDGLVDLYLSKGNLDAMPDRAQEDPSSLMLGTDTGVFLERTQEAGLLGTARARGAAVVDLNLDGLLDLVEVNLGAPVEVWRNAGAGSPVEPRPMGHWLDVELAQAGPNRDAIGAWIEVRAGELETVREVTIGGGHVSGQLGPAHVGLGEATAAEVRVTWPDGEVGPWLPVAADQRLRITRGADEPLALASATVLTGAPALAREGPEGPVLEPVPPVDPASCVRVADPDHSVARLWDEALLDAIRRDFPAPTVHARNLYHTAAAMWDAWAAYDPVAAGVFVDERHTAADVAAAREAAISYAAYRLLSHRYANAVGGAQSLHQFDQLMADLCYPFDLDTAELDGPAALGDRIAASIIETTLDDGSREAERYEYPADGYTPVNEPLIVAEPGTDLRDPNRWQPLALEVSFTQNGQLLPVGPQKFVGQHWGEVTPFALPAPAAPGLPIDPGAPPMLGDRVTDAEYKASALEVLRFSSLLDPADGVLIDISPASLGDNPLGTNDGHGHAFDPYTSLPYAPEVVPRADFARVLAEFWADGPRSETPPGHWNTIANAVTDELAPEQRRIGGTGEPVDALEWDVKLYLALNGAVHDAAVAAWGAKGYYDYVRPISMIRYLGGLGQSSDPALPSYHPEGLPLEPGLVELISGESAAPGERHAHLAEHVGEIAVRAWTGTPRDPGTEVGGVDWIRAVDWVPYQMPTFVTPAFAGYVSGHSTFSRAAAEVLTAFTGSPYFPGGLGTWTIPADSLEFEAGPTEDIELQWATYADAADQAGISRLYGGIHVSADDLRGRVMGAQCGRDAWQLAQRYWEGSART